MSETQGQGKSRFFKKRKKEKKTKCTFDTTQQPPGYHDTLCAKSGKEIAGCHALGKVQSRHSVRSLLSV
jgi:hypothetical protein